ncbi:MAG: repair protein RecN [Pseudomonadota bacterium]|jgi:DNA repair protein RecN (Recombination protein N)
MLETLKIKNLAVIDTAEIPFEPGLNILSGETGAGKSIILEAVSLLLGSRASASWIRSGCDEAIVEGIFRLEELPEIQSRLSSLGFQEQENRELLIKRTVHRSGKHRITINGELATLQNLQALGSGLIELCSQHEHQSLLKPQTQLELLDRYGKLDAIRSRYASAWNQLRALESQLTMIREAESSRLKRLDFLRFQIDELQAAKLQPGEENELQQEKALLQSAQSRSQLIHEIQAMLEGDESQSALQLLQRSTQKLLELSTLDERTLSLSSAIDRALAEVEDVSLSLQRYSRSIDADPDRLEGVQERLATLADLRRKYGEDSTQMLVTLKKLQEELSELEQAEATAETLDSEICQQKSITQELARQLSEGRAKVAQQLSKEVTRELHELNMPDARFQVQVRFFGLDLENYTSSGADEVEFLIQTNRGEVSQAIGKIASGGELSRLMLAIRQRIAGQSAIGVYLFDEIDSGMGGQTAFQVGKKLKSVARHHQVLCITHLPQVASFADHHLVVRKMTQGDRTLTEVHALTSKSKKEELARMLAGATLTKKSLENAQELLDLAQAI